MSVLLVRTTIVVALSAAFVSACTSHPPRNDGAPDIDTSLSIDSPGVSTTSMWSNIPANVSIATSGDWVFNTKFCRRTTPVIDTSTGRVDGCSGQQFLFSEIVQPDTSFGSLPAALFVTKRFVIEQGMTVLVRGNRPLIVLALTDASISGQLQASGLGCAANGGGHSGPRDSNGFGPGGGVSMHGGGFCGSGRDSGDAAVLGGRTYGNPTSVPLLGGSSGGSGNFKECGGAGGGAIQISAGNQIEVTALGVLHVGGGGGDGGSSGGGSGGAILLEAHSVTIRGRLAANGGGGARKSISGNGPNASTDDTSVRGGSAGANINGSGSEGGGGGAAGRIRVNTSTGMVDAANAVISPAIGTTCYSIGRLLAGHVP